MAKDKEQKDGAPSEKPKKEGRPEKPAKGEGKPGKSDAAAAAAPKEPQPPQPKIPIRLKVKYGEEVIPKLRERFGYKNVMAVPRLRRIVLNIGMGEATSNVKLLDGAVAELAQISGQKPIVTRAKKSIAAFKLREGMPIGCCVTLRGDRMYEFLDRFVNIALPRVRDFRGVPSRSFDGRGNYTLGIKEHIIFPEVDYAKVDKVKGLNITFVTSARTDEEARDLLAFLGMPFVRGEKA